VSGPLARSNSYRGDRDACFCGGHDIIIVGQSEESRGHDPQRADDLKIGRDWRAEERRFDRSQTNERGRMTDEQDRDHPASVAAGTWTATMMSDAMTIDPGGG
jgi:hypothetical protein